MTTATALIAEDEPLLADALAADLQRLWPQLRVVARAGDGASALKQALELQPDICILDIRMPGMDGLEAAQAMAEDWPADRPYPLVVFVTAYDQYALQAFDRAAIDYLLKPVDGARLARCVERLQAALARRAAPPVALQQAVDQLRGLLGASPGAGSAPRLDVVQAGVGNTVHVVPIDDVLYFEAADKYVRVVTADQEHLIRTSLRELLPQLDPQRFWQVHRGTVVQARCITAATRDEAGKVALTLRGRPEKVAVSRIYAHRFRAM
jgi:DNA-binding LytR/AlgR family response regulator